MAAAPMTAPVAALAVDRVPAAVRVPLVLGVAAVLGALGLRWFLAAFPGVLRTAARRTLPRAGLVRPGPAGTPASSGTTAGSARRRGRGQ